MTTSGNGNKGGYPSASYAALNNAATYKEVDSNCNAHRDVGGGGGVGSGMLLCPRGLTVVLFLCTISSESRYVYLSIAGLASFQWGESFFLKMCLHCMVLFVIHGSHNKGIACVFLSPPPLSTCSKWWAKQEPLCSKVDNLLSIPERLVIMLAMYVECASLILGDCMGEGRTIPVMLPHIIQAFPWLVHNVFLCAWICLILMTTDLMSLFAMC